MTDRVIDPRRRRVLTHFVRERVVEPVLEAGTEVRADTRREAFAEVYESELRAFGPDVLAETARRSGVAAEGDDYAEVARALANHLTSADDET